MKGIPVSYVVVVHSLFVPFPFPICPFNVKGRLGWTEEERRGEKGNENLSISHFCQSAKSEQGRERKWENIKGLNFTGEQIRY